jgi:hypothetical protein
VIGDFTDKFWITDAFGRATAHFSESPAGAFNGKRRTLAGDHFVFQVVGQLEFLHWFLFDRNLGTVLQGNAASDLAASARYKTWIEKWSVI